LETIREWPAILFIMIKISIELLLEHMQESQQLINLISALLPCPKRLT